MVGPGIRAGIPAVGGAVLLLAGCASYVAPSVTPELRRRAGVDEAVLRRGYVVHEAKCSKCHPFLDPRNYDEAELRDEIMPEMNRKSKLDEADGRAVTAYLLAARRMPVEAQP